MSRRLLSLILLGTIVAGCVQPSASQDRASISLPGHARPTVVALLDTGINPYHTVFQSELKDPAREVGANASTVSLSNGGNWAERTAQDKSYWSAIVPRQLYS